MARKSLFVISSMAIGIAGCGSESSEGSRDGPGSIAINSASLPIEGCTSATTSSGWVNGDLGQRSGTFTMEFDATAPANPSDALFGLSNGPASTYTHLAAIVRFNPTGTIDVRNGAAYAAENVVAYTAGTAYHFTLDVNTVTHTYSVRVRSGNVDTTLATNYAFRTQQAGTSQLTHYATKVDSGGAFTVCGVTVTQPPSCGVSVPSGGFANRSFASQAASFTASFTATPNANNIDGVVGLSAGPASAFSALAAAVRFNPEGTIDVRNGNGYTADVTVPYTAGTPYSFTVVVDVLARTYAVALGGQFLAERYAFRSQQSNVTSLANQASIVDSAAGSLTVCGFRAAAAERTTYIHDTAWYGPASSQRALAALPNGKLAMVETSRTLTLDALGRVTSVAPRGGSFAAADAAGNPYLVGEFQGTYDAGGGPLVSQGGIDVYVAKYNPSFQHLWSQALGTPWDDATRAISVNPQGDIAVMLTGSAGGSVSRLNSNGSTAWGLRTEADALALDAAGNALLLEQPQPWASFTVSKVDRSAAPVWSRTFQVTEGSASLDFVRAAPNGSPILFGTLYGTIDFGGTEVRARPSEEVGALAFVTRLDATGGYASSAIGTMNDLTDVAVDAQGNAFISGVRHNPSWFRVNQFAPSGQVKETTGDSLLLPFSFRGQGGSLAADQVGNLYWRLSLNAENTGNEYLVKLVP
jgi:hypothetical protein